MRWNILALSASFEEQCYGSTTIRKNFTLTVRGGRIDFRRQIPTSEVDSRTVRVNHVRVLFIFDLFTDIPVIHICDVILYVYTTDPGSINVSSGVYE